MMFVQFSEGQKRGYCVLSSLIVPPQYSLWFFFFFLIIFNSERRARVATQPPREVFCVCSASKTDERQGKHGARKFIISQVVSHAEEKLSQLSGLE